MHGVVVAAGVAIETIVSMGILRVVADGAIETIVSIEFVRVGAATRVEAFVPMGRPKGCCGKGALGARFPWMCDGRCWLGH